MQTFTRMDQATVEHWQHIVVEGKRVQETTPVRIKRMLRQLEDINYGFAVNQLEHSLQTATRAERAGASEEMVLAALCHDIGKAISVPNHAAISAEILRPYVSQEVYWVIKNHRDFQGRFYYQYLGQDPEAYRKHEGHPAFDLAMQFAGEWDQRAFDPEYDTFSLEHFEPLIDHFFGCS
ncbi:HD domain-containing protein [Leptolyngbya sp. FACHB-261]|uniref:HD domain-containing protein n=1 Tax=Leptolyngbya sp. FACHB-261 TaxID=2692806 RepID=UPI00168A0389|nr:HD domain-containing protein [Leptolyngbya sp. FACHB-261]MBD2102867.1 HD domain-containing protein [Leptolyngbya sp. FACHB-261]